MTSKVSIFENLPLELLEMIFQHLRRPPYSLYSLVLTSRKFYVLTTPVLYSSICLSNPVNSEQLARTLQQNSWLSSLVLELQVHFHNAEMDQTHEPVLDAIVEMHNLESLSLRSVPLNDILESTNHTLLATLWRNKDNVKIESPTQYAGQRLRSLYLGAVFRGYDRDGWVLGPNEVVFCMEQLEKLHIQGAIIEYLDLDIDERSRKTALKDLAFLNCDVSIYALEQILAFPKGLTHFTMKGPWLDPDGRFEGWGFNNLILTYAYIEIIEWSSSAGVEYLDFDLWNGEGEPEFNRLKCLKHLTICLHRYHPHGGKPDEWFVSIPNFPLSLETLTLNEFIRPVISFGSIIEMVKAGQLPNLRAVTYRNFYDKDEKESEKDWDNDIESFRKLGVELSIASHRGPSITMPENDNWPCECWIYDLTGPDW